MKKIIISFIALSMLAVGSAVFAHDHGGAPASMDHGASQAPMNDQNAKESELLINNCAKYVGQIHQRIQNLQMEIKGKYVSSSVLDELKKLEQNLKEANVIARSLQII
jgi:hypothetical protein